MGLTLFTSKPSGRLLSGKKNTDELRPHFAEISGKCICQDSSGHVPFLPFSVIVGLPVSLLVHAPTLLTYHNEVLTAFSRDSFVTSICAATCSSVLPWPSSVISLELSCHIPPWLRFSCDSLPCSFVPRSLSCFCFALVCFDFGDCPAYYCPVPVLFFPGFVPHPFFMSCFGISSPVQSRPALAFP